MEGVTMLKDGKIVVAVDESEESMYALSWCLRNVVSHDSSCTLVLLYVKPPAPVFSSFHAAGYMFSMERSGKDSVDSVMKRAEAVYRNFNNCAKVERAVGSGDAKDVICGTVEKVNADALVMASRDYGFLKRGIPGSVGEHCAKKLKCPVMIVKHPKERK